MTFNIMLSLKKKNNKLITIFPLSPLQHYQHYGDLMFTFSIAELGIDANINIYFNQVDASYSKIPIYIWVDSQLGYQKRVFKF